MYSILMVINCSGERSFSKLKYIKNRLRTTMTNERVTHISLMSIEYDILRETDFDDLITDFAQRKGKKKCWHYESLTKYKEKFMNLK